MEELTPANVNMLAANLTTQVRASRSGRQP